MTAYEQTLRAYGFPAATAKRDAHANEIGRLNNRERYTQDQEDARRYAAGEREQEVIPYADRRGF